MSIKGHWGIVGRCLGLLAITAVLAACNDNSTASTTADSNGQVALSASVYTVAPSASALLTIHRNGSTKGTATVGYTTVNGTATAGTDYIATSGSVTWGDGDSRPKTISVPVMGAASGKNFGFALTSIAGQAALASPAAATVGVSPASTAGSSSGSTTANSSSSGSNSSSSASSSSGGTGSSGSTGSSSGSTGSTGSSSSSSSNQNSFPHVAVSASQGTQAFNNANNQLLAQYGLITIGGNYPSWPQNGMTRSALVSSLKGQPHTGKNALTPFIVQYEDINEMPAPVPNPEWFPEWNTAVHNNNWNLMQSGASGAMTPSIYNSSYVLVDPAHVVGTDPSTGLYPYALAAKLIYERYYLGTGSGGAGMASTQIDAYIVDNMSQRDMAGGQADWLRNGTSPGQTDPTATAAVTLGKADFPAELAALNPNIVAGGNTEFGYDCAPNSAGGMGMPYPTNLSGKLGLTLQQFLWATAGTQSNVLDFAGFDGAMTWYEVTETNTKSGGYIILTGGVLANDYQLVRYSLAFTLMRNGWAQYAISSSGQDSVDPSDTSTFPVFDEFWGGSLNTAGYLGSASGTAQGAEQSSSWQQGVWRRDFDNGIVLANPTGNGTQTVSLGGTFYHLNGSQAPSINNGAAVTSITLAPGDGVILLRNAPP